MEINHEGTKGGKRMKKESISEVSVSASFLTSGNIPSNVMNYGGEEAPTIFTNGHNCPYQENVVCKMLRVPTKEECILCLLSKIVKDVNLTKNKKMEEKK